jgi:phosphomethylpyrimidine synthase
MLLDFIDDLRPLAKKEGISVAKLRNLAACGKIVVPKNVKTKRKVRLYLFGGETEPKILTNIGTSDSKPDISYVLECAKKAVTAGSHGIYDCSVAGDLRDIRSKLLDTISIPFGANPIYQTASDAERKHGSTLDMTEDDIINAIETEAREGADMETINVPSLRMMKDLEKDKRLLGVVSRGAAILMKWMKHHGRENPLLTHYDSILDIAAKYNLTLNLNDGMRSGCIFDTFDSAYLEGLIVTRELVDETLKRGIQVFIDGPGHVSTDEIDIVVKLTKKACRGVPLAMLGPLATDFGVGLHHISAAIGGARAVEAGADLLYSITPAEHLGLPTPVDVRKGVLACSIAINAGLLARDGRSRDTLKSFTLRKIGRNQRKYNYLRCSVAREILNGDETIEQMDKARQCTLCSPFCPIRIWQTEEMKNARK